MSATFGSEKWILDENGEPTNYMLEVIGLEPVSGPISHSYRTVFASSKVSNGIPNEYYAVDGSESVYRLVGRIFSVGDEPISSFDGIEGIQADVRDPIIGTSGDDIIESQSGSDTLTGSRGRDTFSYDSIDDRYDTITDFNHLEDSFDISGIYDSISGFVLEDLVSITDLGNSSEISLFAHFFKGSKEYSLGQT